MEKTTAILLLSCPDQKGIVAGISRFISEHNGNILDAAQYSVQPENMLFMRVEWDLDGFTIARDDLEETISPLVKRFGMKWTLHFSDYIPKMAIFVSRHIYCFHDLILRHQMGEFKAQIPLVISNHLDMKPLADHFGLPFRHYPITGENRAEQEKKQIAELEREGIDLIILARYMQILSGEFVSRYHDRIINIHHSFLPAFAGGNPYQQAYDRGVKLIGATSHYVTEMLDEGPIIVQDVIKITHKDSVDTMKLKGKDLERIVLAKAVRLHLEHRILVYGSKTIIFD
ncbi:MAG TPA: formyltetrahydrofolate deformylase [Syntrophales bacterium]|nr:formyltetrahydrofolate deformylase [Syntrophales bacterium]HPQ43111.1 formyltetrahydrofolate deformylase [Syntrophales bacterium]